MEEKSVRSAVVVMPPEHFWPPIQAIRSNLKPFRILFSKDSIGCFKHHRKAVVWLKPLFIKQRDVNKVTAKQLTPYNVTQKSVIKTINISQVAEKPSVTQNVPMTAPVLQSPYDVKQEAPMAQKITVTEPIIQSPYSGTAKHGTNKIGLDVLASAVWGNEDLVNINKLPQDLQPGLDCLRYATWGMESEQRFDHIFSKQQKTQLKQYTPEVNDNCNSEPVKVTKPVKVTEPVKVGIKKKSIEQEYNEKNEYEENENTLPWSTVSYEKSVKAQKETEGYITIESKSENRETHPDVIKLQTQLFKTFSFCNDLNNKSREGFQPHLTLGQCDTKDVDNFIENLRKNWKDFYFTVDSVYIISRRSFDPFEVRETISLQ